MEKTPSKFWEFLEMLTSLFIGLKLTGHIDWSWWWVLAPLWAPLAIILAGALLFDLCRLLQPLADWMAEKLGNLQGRLKEKAYQQNWRFPTDLPISE